MRSFRLFVMRKRFVFSRKKRLRFLRLFKRLKLFSVVRNFNVNLRLCGLNVKKLFVFLKLCVNVIFVMLRLLRIVNLKLLIKSVRLLLCKSLRKKVVFVFLLILFVWNL